ncbi:MAG: aminopeptidase P family N-terminal domain-containing protein, partial [Gemmatimonadetes bacterium]|nr:aminopeptidase P family N-terminal domain-containing protein [Gemmatimonadota bacterium]
MTVGALFCPPLTVGRDHLLRRTRQEASRGNLGHPIDGLLVSNAPDIRYLTGFVGDDSLLLVGGVEGATIISDTRYDEFLEPWAALGHVD